MGLSVYSLSRFDRRRGVFPRGSRPTNPKGRAMTKSTKAKTSPKTAPKAKAEAKPTVAELNGGLRKPQIRVLRLLGKSGKAMDRAAISEKAPVDQASCVEYLGSHDDAVRKANDKKHFPSLVTLGYVAHEDHEDSGVTYEITAKGKKFLRDYPDAVS